MSQASDPWKSAWTLFQAVRRYAAVERGQEFDDLAQQTAGKRQIHYNPEFTDPARVATAKYTSRMIRRRDSFWRMMCRELVWELRSGALVARGFEAPVSPTSSPVIVRAELWEVLKPNFRNSSATTDGLTFVGLKVLHRDENITQNLSTSTIAAEKRCEAWLRDHAAGGSKPWGSKHEALAAARVEISPGLSGRAFERAWKRAAPPDWRLPGRKSAH